MKCPHCGIEIRDTMTVCMYCGGKIPQRSGMTPAQSGKATDIPRTAGRAPADPRDPENPEGEGEEEGGGLVALLQQGEQILIGSLNVSVKKFFYHAYLTDKRIFLIDTQEKKIKATAKDIPLETIAGSIVEISESSDPVLAISVKAPDDEVKTLKLVFSGDGTDRSEEVDEWIDLLNEYTQQPKRKRKSPVRRAEEPVPEEEPAEEPLEEEAEEEPAPITARPRAPPQEPVRAGPSPAKRQVKSHETQPPVKRLLSTYKTAPQEEAAPEEEIPLQKPAKAPVREEPQKKPSVSQQPFREIPSQRDASPRTVRSTEVQSAMKGALKGPVPHAKPVSAKVPVEKPVPAPVVATTRRPLRIQPEPEPLVEEEPAPVQEPPEEEYGEEPEGEEAAAPIYCQTCGKKLPAAANFCPGCGSRIAPPREKTAVQVREKSVKKAEAVLDVPDEEEPEEPPRVRPVKPPVRKVPKGSEMTILHKFLRR